MNFIKNTITTLLITGLVLCGTQTLFSNEDEQPVEQSKSMSAMQELIAAFQESQAAQAENVQAEPENDSTTGADDLQPSNITEEAEEQQDCVAEENSEVEQTVEIEQQAPVQEQAVEVQSVEQQENQVENQLT